MKIFPSLFGGYHAFDFIGVFDDIATCISDCREYERIILEYSKHERDTFQVSCIEIPNESIVVSRNESEIAFQIFSVPFRS